MRSDSEEYRGTSHSWRSDNDEAIHSHNSKRSPRCSAPRKVNTHESILDLLHTHPGFLGIHINVEPWPSGNRDLMALLAEIRRVMPQNKILSIAAYPPPTFWQPVKAIHWDETYFRRIAELADQMVVSC